VKWKGGFQRKKMGERGSLTRSILFQDGKKSWNLQKSEKKERGEGKRRERL